MPMLSNRQANSFDQEILSTNVTKQLNSCASIYASGKQTALSPAEAETGAENLRDVLRDGSNFSLTFES